MTENSLAPTRGAPCVNRCGGTASERATDVTVNVRRARRLITSRQALAKIRHESLPDTASAKDPQYSGETYRCSENFTSNYELTCCECQRGFEAIEEQPGGQMESKTSCVGCSAGYYKHVSGSSRCSPCEAGRFSHSVSSTSCTACEAEYPGGTRYPGGTLHRVSPTINLCCPGQEFWETRLLLHLRCYYYSVSF